MHFHLHIFIQELNIELATETKERGITCEVHVGQKNVNSTGIIICMHIHISIF